MGKFQSEQYMNNIHNALFPTFLLWRKLADTQLSIALYADSGHFRIESTSKINILALVWLIIVKNI